MHSKASGVIERTGTLFCVLVGELNTCRTLDIGVFVTLRGECGDTGVYEEVRDSRGL